MSQSKRELDVIQGPDQFCEKEALCGYFSGSNRSSVWHCIIVNTWSILASEVVKVVAVCTVVRPAYWEHSGGTGYGRGYPLTEKQELLVVLA